MKLTFCAMGDINEIQPFITMADYFNTEEHEVTIVCNSDYKSITDQYNLNFIALPILVKDVMDNGLSNIDMITNTKKYVNKFKGEISSCFPILIDATKDSDIVFYNTAIVGIADISEQFGFEIIKVGSLPHFYPSKKVKYNSKNSLLSTIYKKSHNLVIEKNVITIINSHRRYYFNKYPRSSEAYNYQIGNKKIKHILANSSYIYGEDIYEDDNVLVPGFMTFPTLKTLDQEVIAYLEKYPNPILYDRRYTNIKYEEDFYKVLKQLDSELNSGVIVVGDVEQKYIDKFSNFYFANDIPIKLLSSYALVSIHNGGLNSYVNGFEVKCLSIAICKTKEEKFFTSLFTSKDLCLKPIRNSGMYVKKLKDSLKKIEDSKLQLEVEKIHNTIYEENTLDNIAQFINL